VNIGAITGVFGFDKKVGMDIPAGVINTAIGTVNLVPGVHDAPGAPPYAFAMVGTWPGTLTINTTTGVISGNRPATPLTGMTLLEFTITSAGITVPGNILMGVVT
jgi:hypothetical protein